MELRTAIEALSPITKNRALDTLPALQHIALYADPDGNLTGALATDRYILARIGEPDDAPAAYLNLVQAAQVLAQLKARSTSILSPKLDREAGTILGIPVTMPDDMGAFTYPSHIAKILDDALAAEETQLPVHAGLVLPVMEMLTKVLKPMNRGKSSRNRNNVGLRLAARGNVILTTVEDLTLIVMPRRGFTTDKHA